VKTVGFGAQKERLSLAVKRVVMTQTLFGRRRKEQQKERKKDKFLSKVMLSECKQWHGDVCWLMTFQHGDKCVRKREVYGWAEVFKISWSIVGDAHSGLP